MGFGKGKKFLRPIISISFEEKTPQKTQNNVEIRNGLEKESSEKKKDYSKILCFSKMDGVVKLSQQRILSGESEHGKGQITIIFRHSMLRSLSTNNPWESIP